MNEQAKNVPEVTIEHCKQVDAVVHSDGNIFFTSIDKLNKAVALAASQPPIEADTIHGGLEHQPDGSVHFEEYPTPAKDKARLDWLQNQGYAFGFESGDGGNSEVAAHHNQQETSHER